MYTVRIYGDPVLRKQAEPVTKFDKQLAAFAEEMVATMHERDGVGLAAPQVGKSIAVVVVSKERGDESPYVLVNPQITYASEQTEESEEGCLSIPELNAKVCRPSIVSVSAQDTAGKPVTIEMAGGLLARALQHEIDHLCGIMFIDRTSILQRQLLSGKLKKLAKSKKSSHKE
jgi:peptide deformylase